METTKPKKSETRQRNDRVNIRVSSNEKKIFQSRVEESGLSAADYFRQQCLAAAPIRVQAGKKIDPDFVRLHAKLNVDLARVGNNLNQIARTLNEANLRSPGQVADIYQSDREIMLQCLVKMEEIQGAYLKHLQP